MFIKLNIDDIWFPTIVLSIYGNGLSNIEKISFKFILTLLLFPNIFSIKFILLYSTASLNFEIWKSLNNEIGDIIKRILSLIVCDNTRGKTRFAVVVSKKTLKSAVGRNRIRRRVYEAIRLNFDKFKKSRDYIFVVYSKGIKDQPFSELQKTIRSLLEESMIQ